MQYAKKSSKFSSEILEGRELSEELSGNLYFVWSVSPSNIIIIYNQDKYDIILIVSMSSFKKKQGYKKSNRLSAPRKEPIYKKIPLVGSTHYLSLSNNDLIYFGNLHQFNVEIFRVTIEKMTLDLNLLLSYGYDDFWKELSSSSSLRLSL